MLPAAMAVLSACSGNSSGPSASGPSAGPSTTASGVPQAVRVVDRIRVGGRPDGIATGGGSVWVADFDGNTCHAHR